VAYIGNDLQVAFSTYKNIDDISGSFDGVTTSFALLVNGVAPAPLPLNSNQCLISVGGVVQRPDDTGTEGFRLSGGNIVFSSAPNTAEDFFGVILAGADYVNAGANFPDGTLAAPSITFDQDNDTGYYRSGSGAVSFASNGVAAGTWSSAGVTAPALIPTGSSVPANGVYLPAANTVGVATNGANRLSISSAGEVTTTNEKLNLITVGRGGGAVATNTAVGTGALAVNSTGARLTAVGNNAGTVNTASDNAFVGYNTGAANTSGTNNTAVGSQALATNISGSNNTAVGYTTLLVSTGSNNTGVGGGTYPLATLANNTTGGSNTAVGTSALSSNSTGSSNICFGKDSGSALTTGSNNTIIGSIAGTAGLADTVIIGAGTTERLRIDSSGRLLVGTSTARSNFNNTTDTTRLQIEGTDAATSSFSLVCNNGGGVPVASIHLAKSASGSIGSTTAVSNNWDLGDIRFSGSDGTEFVQAASIACEVDGTPGANDMPGRLVFSTTADGASSPTERMRIRNTGTIYARGNGSVFSFASNVGAGTSDWLQLGGHSATGILTYTISYAVYTNGNVVNTNGSYTAISDAKLKENIVDAGSQWNDLKAIQIRNWNFKAETGHETHRQIGPIAQELETVCPGLVFETPDRDEDGNETGEVTKGVNQSVLYMKAVKALQEAMERIEQLETEMAAVKAQLS
jgi:hypothetical protein